MSKRLPDRETDTLLQALYAELHGVEVAIDQSLWVVETEALQQRRAELLGQIKKREREHATSH